MTYSRKRLLKESSIMRAEEEADRCIENLLEVYGKTMAPLDAAYAVREFVDGAISAYEAGVVGVYESFEDLLGQRRVIKESTDPIEVGDIIWQTMKPGIGYTYGDLEAMANRQAGQDVSWYVESAIQYLESQGDIKSAARSTAIGVPGGKNYMYMYYKVR